MVTARRVVAVLVAGAVLAGCGVQPEEVPGAAAPAAPTRTPTPTPGATAPTPTATTPSPTATTPTPTPTPTPTTPSATPAPTTSAPQVPPPLPLRYETLTMTGFGATITLPVPADWTRKTSDSAGRRNTDLVPPGAPDLLLLRVDLTARGPGTAEDGAKRVEAGARLPGYRRGAFMEVTELGDDAVDWYFTYDLDGIRMWVCDRMVVAGTAGIAVYLRVPDEVNGDYQPLLSRVLNGLRITTSGR